jgi:uncharacterized membrane protein
MAKIERTITIKAPVEKVFGYLTEPTNLPEIWPSMVEVKDVKQHIPRGVGDTFRWVYKMVGVRFEGLNETTEFVPNQHVATKNTGGIPSTFRWMYRPEDGGTKLTMDAEYTIPVPLLGKVAEPFIVKANEHEADVMLANLKARMET